MAVEKRYPKLTSGLEKKNKIFTHTKKKFLKKKIKTWMMYLRMCISNNMPLRTVTLGLERRLSD